VASCGGGSPDDETTAEAASARHGRLVQQRQQIFRLDTFGDERQWTDALRLHEVINSAVDPLTALSVGLKVDAEALPPAVVAGIQNGSVDLTSPATTIALLKLDAVVGLKGHGRNRQRCRSAGPRRHHLRTVPFDRRQLLCARH